jgi:hypothetical protein
MLNIQSWISFKQQAKNQHPILDVAKLGRPTTFSPKSSFGYLKYGRILSKEKRVYMLPVHYQAYLLKWLALFRGLIASKPEARYFTRCRSD